ncbi:hypothetical protein BH09GEM1_BH09GEM1_38880 [soil metagenome]
MRQGYIAGLMLLVAVAGCEDDKAKGLLAPAALPTQAVRAYVVQEPGATAEKVTLTIHVEARGIPVAAYQGKLEFDADALEIIDASTPGEDGTRIVNAKAHPGVVKFAGFSAEAFLHTAAVTLVVKPKKPLELANLLATLDVVGEAKGTQVAKEHVLLQKGVFTTIAKQ